ncbi:hypothetical protein [Namhaeicola litoreus]|uniref:Lipoprotein n=1 Tax=Namhaeicola litoreus TaxID=1052145 RepID=A0ABW3Y4E4_9FLAO
MRSYYLILLLLTLLACNQKTVELPKLSVKGTTDLYNTSQIWFFLELNGPDTIAKVNSKNKITNTHLIFNIDKKLRLKHIINPIQEIQEKVNASSVHKIEGMHQYFSYADTLHQEFSLFDFTDTIYMLDQDSISEANQILLVCGNEILYRDQKITLNELTKLSVEIGNDTNEIELRFCQNTLYEDYLFVLTTLKQCNVPTRKGQVIISKE